MVYGWWSPNIGGHLNFRVAVVVMVVKLLFLEGALVFCVY